MKMGSFINNRHINRLMAGATVLLIVLFALALSTQYVGPLSPALITAAAQHEGQPSHCTNAKGQEKSKNFCKCQKTPGDDGAGCETEDKSCKVYCRKTDCGCFHPGCDS